MIKRFGSRIDTTIASEELAYFLSGATRRKIEAEFLSKLPQLERAMLFAQADNFYGRLFKSLSSLFAVSPQAMGIRLLELGLIV